MSVSRPIEIGTSFVLWWWRIPNRFHFFPEGSFIFAEENYYVDGAGFYVSAA